MLHSTSNSLHIHFLFSRCTRLGLLEVQLCSVKPGESNGFLLRGLIFPSSLRSECRDKQDLIYTSSMYFSLQHHLLSDRSSCTSWQIGHVISRIPAVLPCSQDFCQRSIWRSNFTKVGTSADPEHSYAQYIDMFFSNMYPWWKGL